MRQFNRNYIGDYEGIARAGNTLYILRSDGTIIEISDFKSDNFKRISYSTGIPLKDNEGLCYDNKNNRLLIAPKEIPREGSGDKNMRFIYGFDLSSKKLVKEPVFKFSISHVEKFAIENKIEVPMKGKKGEKKEPDIEMGFSAIGIHPKTGRLFILSAADRLLSVFNMSGKIEYIAKLNSDLFKQPEGITFMDNGDMFISNEGKQQPPTLVRFNYRH